MFTDLHCHLLYGIDDGPTEPAGTVAIARLLVAVGYGTVATTPHALPQFPGQDVVAQRRAEVEELLAREQIPLKLFSGAENRLDEEYLEAELGGHGRHLAGSSYSLVEAPYQTVVPSLPDLLFRLRRKGITPVLAHPERCAEFQELARAEEAVRLGGVLQLDLGSLAGTYGRQAKKTAHKLLEAGLYSVASTDLHEAEISAKWLRQGIHELENRAGRAGVERLMVDNPARVIRGEELV